MSDNLAEVKSIITELYNEFLDEENKMNDICDSHSVRIDELDHKISGFRKNDDVDFKVFSPRNQSSYNTDKINELEAEKEDLEREKSFSMEQLRYYSDKVKKFEKIIALLNISIENSKSASTNHNISIDYFDDEVIDENEVDDIDSLFPLSEKQKHDAESGEDIDKVISNIDSLFRNSLLSSVKGKDDYSGEDNIIADTSDEISVQNESDNDDLSLEKTDDKLDTTGMNSDDNKKQITPGDIAHIIHKAEFTTKIMSNDSHRAKLELNEIINMLRKLIN